MARAARGRCRGPRCLSVRLAVVVALGVATAAVACRRTEPREDPSPAASARAPAKAPAALIAEAVIVDASTVWARMRGVRPTPALPHDARLLVPLLLGLAPTTAGLVSLERPVVAALLAARGEPILVVGVPLESERELVAHLTTGRAAPFRAVAAGALTAFRPKQPSTEPSLAAGFGYLWVAPEAGRIAEIAPYLAHRIARGAGPGGAALRLSARGEHVGSALAAALRSTGADLHAWLSEGASRARTAQGRPADLADPEAAIALLDQAVGAAARLSEDVIRISGELEPGTDTDRIALEFEVREGSAAARWLAATSGASPFIPPSARAPLIVELPIAGRWVPTAVDALRSLLGDRADDATRAALDSVARAWAASSTGPATLAVVGAGPERRLVVRTPLRSEASAGALVAALEAAAEAPAVRALVDRARADPDLAASPGGASIWSVEDQTLTLALGSGGDALRRVESSAVPTEVLGAPDRTAAARLRAGAGTRLFAAALLVPSAAPAESGAWTVVVVETQGTVVRLRWDVDRGAAEALVRAFDPAYRGDRR